MLQMRGIKTPTEQMYLLVRFVVEVVGGAAYAEEFHSINPEGWLAEKLGESLKSWHHDPSQFHDWHTLFTNSQTVLDWDPYREFGDLLEMRYSEKILRRAEPEVSQRLGGPSIGFIVAVAEDFRERRLPAAMRGFDPVRGKGHEEAWLATVFRWFILRRATADRSVREQLMFFGPIEGAPLRPDEIIEQLEDGLVAQNLLEGLHTINPRYVDVLRSYFGLDGHEHALHELASRYGISHHTARWLVVDALTALSVRLGVQRLLSKEEFAFAQLVFEKGMPTKVAAGQLEIAESAIKMSIHSKFHAVLRKRTTLRHPDQRTERPAAYSSKPVPTRASHQPKVLQMDREEIIAALWRLRDQPKIDDDGTQKLVSLGGSYAPLTDVRSLLAKNEELCDTLVAEGVPLDWIFTHDGERVDIFPGEDTLSVEIEKIASREWTVAEFVLVECIKRAGQKELPVLTAQSATDEPVARIVETLGGLSVALLRMIDARLRQARPLLHVWQDADGIYGRWGDKSEKFGLVPFILRQSMRFGEFRYDAATVVADTIGTLLSCGELPLPGFSLEQPSSGVQIFRPHQTIGESK
jgi:hypothetical protein